MDVGFTITLGCISIIAVLWYIWRKRRMTLFERLGIPGPKPHFITGNVNNSSEQASLSIEWEKKYGKIYGIYLGAWPFLVVSDVELLKLVQIKEFKTFQARAIMPIATEVMDIFLKKIAETNQETFDITPLIKSMSFDVNSRASFGISTGIQHNDESHFIRSVYRSFDADSGDALAKAMIYYPELHSIPKMVRIIRDRIRHNLNFPSATTVINACAQIVNMRKDNPETARPDLLQGLVDASEISSNKNNQEFIKKEISSHEPLTENEVIGNAFGFMLAGFEAISVILSFCVHYIVDNPKIQDKLREEIKEKVQGEIDYDTLSKLTYLDQIISETLRMFPFNVIGLNRTAMEDFNYKGITIPKGMNVGIALHALNMDPNYWKDPEVFRPERFSPENGNIDNTIYQPFGAGPRNCIGMRFAQVLMKTIAASLFQRFQLENPPDAKPFELEHTVFLVRPKYGIQVRAIPV